MGTQAIMTPWCVAFCLGLIAVTQCIPIEVVYTGEGCDCPSKLDFLINIPKVPKTKKYPPSQYGYKVDVPPVQAKAKVSYSFDFTVEEPRTPKPPKPNRLNLYAKVDRVAINRGDCEDNYAAATAPPATCSCAQCGVTKPLYRYVYQKVQPCRCQRANCKCNERRAQSSPNSVAVMRISPMETAESRSGYYVRRKRDLHRVFFQPHKSEYKRRTRYVKLYHKALPHTKHHSSFEFDELVSPVAKKIGPKRKRMLYPRKHMRIVKRDIKGEYDLLEKEREQMDLTVPEIIQYMPETLQPNFKRGQCHFGCARRRSEASQDDDVATERNNNKEETANNNSNNNNDNDNSDATDQSSSSSENSRLKEDRYYKRDEPPADVIAASTFTKRNAGYFDYGTSSSRSAHNAYEAQLPCQISTNPHAKHTPAAQSAYSAPAPATAGYSATEASSQNSGRMRFVVSSVPDPVGTGALPLHYAGDLETPAVAGYSTAHQDPMLSAPHRYEVQHISNEQLDRIISDIIYRHPAFIDAGSHYGGALVDPEPWQERETKDFLKKLIDGRFNMWFGHEEEHRAPYIPSYGGNPYLFPSSTY